MTDDDPVVFGIDVTADGEETVAAARRRPDGTVVLEWIRDHMDVDVDEWQADVVRRVYGNRWTDVGTFRQKPVDWASIMDGWDDDVRAIATLAATPRITITLPATFRGLEDNVTGRVHHDDLHPDNRAEWTQTVEGRDATGDPQVVCEHCGEPVPCVEGVLRHMETDMHHTFCRPVGHCCVARRPVTELPTR